MAALHPVVRQRRVDHHARRIVGAVALGHRPPTDRRDPLLDAARGLALLVPDGLQHRHDVAGRDLRHRQRAEARIGVGLKTRLPLRPRLRVAPARRMDGDDRLLGLGERRRRGPAPGLAGTPARLGDLPALEGRGPRLGEPHRRVVSDLVVGAPAPDGEPLNPHLRAPRGDAQVQPVLVDEPRRPLGGFDLSNRQLAHGRTTIRNPISDTDKRLFISMICALEGTGRCLWKSGGNGLPLRQHVLVQPLAR